MNLNVNEYQVNQLYEQQQAYFAQFDNKNPQKPEQYYNEFEWIRQLDSKKSDKNQRLPKQCNGKVELVLQKQKKERIRKPKEQIDLQNVIKTTTTLILDCNNMKYSGEKWNQFHGKPMKQIIQSLDIVMLWCQQEGNILKTVNLIWDVLHFKIFNEIQKSDDIHSLFFSEISQQLKNQKKQLQYDFIISNGMGQFLNLSIASSQPRIADDYIVQILSDQDNSKTTVVTSDRILRQRLKEIGVGNFIGNAKYWRFQQLIDLCHKI